MKFHRFKQPTYYAAPSLSAAPTAVTFNGVDYDFFNVVSEGVGAGGSAFLGGYKPSGPNTGTYGVAFGEDATSSNANRGILAAIQNTDTLDDWMHRDLAVPVRTTSVTAGAPISSIVLPVDTYVGTGVSYPLDSLFSVLNSDHEEILNGDVEVVVASITGAAIGSGYSGTSITLNLTPAIPTGATYYVAYATRSNLATLPEYALVSIGVRSSDEVGADVARMVGHLKGEPSGAWDQNPLFSTYGIGSSGLNSLYRRGSGGVGFSTSTTVLSSTIDVAGSGAEVLADGRALSAVMQRSYAGFTSSIRYQDPLQALFRAEETGAPLGAAGRIGFVSISNGPDPLGATNPSIGSFAAYSRIGLGDFTDIIEGSSASLDVDPGASQALIIDFGSLHTQGAGEYSNALRLGRDLVRILLPATIDAVNTLGDREITLRVVGAPTGTSLQVVGVDGRLPTQLATLAGPITVTVKAYYSARVLFPNGAGSHRYALDSGPFNANDLVKDGSIEFFPPKANTLAEAALFTEATAKFWGNTSQNPFEWGREGGAGIPVRTGYMTSLGDVQGRQFRGSSVDSSTVVHSRVVSNSPRVTNDYAKTPRFFLTYTGLASATAIFLEWDGDRTFPRTGLDNERVNSLGTTGARFPRTVFVSIDSAVNMTAPVRLPTRDVTVGDEVNLVLLLQPSGGATIAVDFVDWSFGNGGVDYASAGFNAAGAVHSVGSSSRRVFNIKLACLYNGVHPVSGDIVTYWSVVHSIENTIGAPLGELLIGLTAGTNAGAITQTVAAANTLINLGQLV